MLFGSGINSNEILPSFQLPYCWLYVAFFYIILIAVNIAQDDSKLDVLKWVKP